MIEDLFKSVIPNQFAYNKTNFIPLNLANHANATTPGHVNYGSDLKSLATNRLKNTPFNLTKFNFPPKLTTNQLALMEAAKRYKLPTDVSNQAPNSSGNEVATVKSSANKLFPAGLNKPGSPQTLNNVRKSLSSSKKSPESTQLYQMLTKASPINHTYASKKQKHVSVIKAQTGEFNRSGNFQVPKTVEKANSNYQTLIQQSNQRANKPNLHNQTYSLTKKPYNSTNQKHNSLDQKITAGFSHCGKFHVSNTVKAASSVNNNLNQYSPKDRMTAKTSSATKPSVLINHTNNNGLNYAENYQTSYTVGKGFLHQANVQASKVADNNLMYSSELKLLFQVNYFYN